MTLPKIICSVAARTLLLIQPRVVLAATSATSTDTIVTRPASTFAANAVTSDQRWNWHLQNTDVLQGDPPFPAQYSGPNSLNNHGEVEHTLSIDLTTAVRLWSGAAAYADGLMWQGFGLSHTVGIEAFPNGEAFRLGTTIPNVNLARIFVRQTIDLGGESEPVRDDALHLAGSQDASRLTFTLGRFSAKDIFDNNTYANDPRTQFMNWGLMANEAWDYPADSLGYITGTAVEWHQPNWALRGGWFQMPRAANGTATDTHFAKAWGLVTEIQTRYGSSEHQGAFRLLAYLNRVDMGSYAAAVVDARLTGAPADIAATRRYRFKHGLGINWEQAFGMAALFGRAGWSDGQNEGWVFSDVDRTVSLGLHVAGRAWSRPDDTWAIAGVANGLSSIHQAFFDEGGLGILSGDGRLSYDAERVVETYYDVALPHNVHLTCDAQWVANPAFNHDRGPVAVFAARLHWER